MHPKLSIVSLAVQTVVDTPHRNHVLTSVKTSVPQLGSVSLIFSHAATVKLRGRAMLAGSSTRDQVPVELGPETRPPPNFPAPATRLGEPRAFFTSVPDSVPEGLPSTTVDEESASSNEYAKMGC